jgi:hypothetical protein
MPAIYDTEGFLISGRVPLRWWDPPHIHVNRSLSSCLVVNGWLLEGTSLADAFYCLSKAGVWCLLLLHV